MKTFRTQTNIGKVKYSISFHDGKKTHSDGSPFDDIMIFKNKVKFKKAIKDLENKGYKERGLR